MMHPEIEKLIDLAAKGDTITARQREIIRNKAIALGEDPDEAELVLNLTVKKNQRKNQSNDDIEIVDKHQDEQYKRKNEVNAEPNEFKTPASNETVDESSSIEFQASKVTSAVVHGVEGLSIKHLSEPVMGTNRSKLAASLLALFFGGLGIHKFYLGNTKSGILYLLFSWTLIPMFLGWIDAFRYLFESDNSFRSHINKGK